MAPNNGLDLSNHPLFYLRRFMIICGVIGIGPAIFVITLSKSSYLSADFGYALFWLLVSITLSCWDLVHWKLKRTTSLAMRYQTLSESELPYSFAAGCDDDNGDDNYRPRKLILLLDLILSFVFASVFMNIVVEIQQTFSWRYDGYYYREVETIMGCTYGSVSLFINAICHILCFWKELMARKKNGWERAICLNRREWQEQFNKFLDAAAQFVADSNRPNIAAHGQCGGRCSCASYAEDIAHLVRREKQLVEKLEAMRMAPGSSKIDDGYEEVIEPNHVPTADHKGKGKEKARDLPESDVEAGLTYQHEALRLLTPSSSATDSDVEAASGIVESAARSHFHPPTVNFNRRQDRH